MLFPIFEIDFFKNKAQENFILYFYTKILSPSQFLNSSCIKKSFVLQGIFRKIIKINYMGVIYV